MSNNFELTVAFMQVILLALWEAIGALYFGWSPVAVALCWFAGIFTFNISVATALRTSIKLPTPQAVVSNTVVSITEEDGVG